MSLLINYVQWTTVEGRVVYFDQNTKCIFVLMSNLEMVRVYLPNLPNQICVDSLLHVKGGLTRDKLGKIMHLGAGCSYILDTNASQIINSEILICQL